MSSEAHELSGVKMTIKAGLEHFRSGVVLLIYQSFGWLISVLEKHRQEPLVHVLTSTDPSCYCPLPRQSQSTISLEIHHTNIRLDPKVFDMIDRRYGPDSVDLFATRDNRLLDRFISWRPDPSAIAVDAFMSL